MGISGSQQGVLTWNDMLKQVKCATFHLLRPGIIKRLCDFSLIFYLFRNSLFFWPCVPSLTQQGLITLLSLPAWHQHRAPQHTLTPHDTTAPCAPTISGSGQAYKSLSTVCRQLSVIWKLWPLWPSFPQDALVNCNIPPLSVRDSSYAVRCSALKSFRTEVLPPSHSS